MKKTLLLGLIALCSLEGNSQEILFSEDFEDGDGAFELNTDDEGGTPGVGGANQWVASPFYSGGAGTDTDCSFSDVFVNTVPAQPAAITSANGSYLHIYSDVGFNFCFSQNANYMSANTACSTDESHFAAMSSDISTLGYEDVTLSFWWLCDGNAFAYGELYYSIDAGDTWILIDDPIDEYRDVLDWEEETISDPAFDFQPTLRFGFRFVNEFDFSGYNNLMAWGIDDVTITGTPGSGCADSFSSFIVDECMEYTVPSGSMTVTESMTVMDTIPNSAGCDSIMTIEVNIDTVDVGVTEGTFTLTADAAGAGITYQWIDCSDNSALSGETNQTLDLVSSGIDGGQFAVIVNDNGCIDTSDCYEMWVWGLDEFGLGSQVKLYPNPVSNHLNIDLGAQFERVQMQITDLSGKILLEEEFFNVNHVKNVAFPFEKGLYLIRLTDQDGRTALVRLVKE